jgi:hypothetical protein
MADHAFDRTPLYPLEKPLADDINQGFSQGDRSLRDTVYELLGGVSGFLKGSLQVVQQGPPALGVTIKAGLGFQDAPTDVPGNIGGVVGLSDLSRYKPIVLTNDLNVAVPAPPGANSRIDLIEVAYVRQLDNPQSRNFLDPSTSAFAPSLVSKTLDFTVDGTLAYYSAVAVPTTALAYKSGVASASPSAPATDTGYLPLVYITVASGVVTIVSANIVDQRSTISFGALLGRQIITASGTYTPTAGTKRVRLRGTGAGGGGGGAAGGGNSASAGGGASGAAIDQWIDGGNTAITGGAVVVGAAGAGGAAGANTGGTGGDSTIAINGVTYTAKGGTGGIGGSNTAGQALAHGGVVQSGSTAGPIAGQDGGPGMNLLGSSGVCQSGAGGSGPFGVGGDPVGAGSGGDGTVGQGYGSGGSGAQTQTATSLAGSAGAPGVWIVEEYDAL